MSAALVVPRPVEDGDAAVSAGVTTEPAGGRAPAAAGPGPAARPGWAALLRRVFAFDVLHCPICGGRRRTVAVHTRAETLGPLLARLGLAESRAAAPVRSPPRPAA